MILKTSEVCNEKWMKNFYMYQHPHTVMYDADSLERINISDFFTDEGLEYIYQSALQNGFGTNTDENRGTYLMCVPRFIYAMMPGKQSGFYRRKQGLEPGRGMPVSD